MEEFNIGDIAKRIAAQYDAIHMGYIKELCMKHNIPFVEDPGVMISTLKQKGYELILEKSEMNHTDDKKHYALKLVKIVDTKYYAIKNPELKIGK